MTISKETRKIIGRKMSSFFISHGLTHKDVAEIMNIAEQSVSNHTHGGPIGRKTREAYFIAFGFEPEYLLSGKGTLLKAASGYQKLKKENEQLRAIIKAQRATIKKLSQKEP